MEAKSAIDGTWKSLRPNNNSVLVAHESGDKGVIVQRTQTVCINGFSYLRKFFVFLQVLFFVGLLIAYSE